TAMLNPWPVAIRLIIGLAVTIGAVVVINRYASDEPAPPPPDVRVAVFNDVYDDVDAGRVRLKRWRDASGRTLFPGIGLRECGALRDAAASDTPVNDGLVAGRLSATPAERD